MTNPFILQRPNIFLTAFFRSGSSHVKTTLNGILPTYHQATTVFSAGAIGNDNNCAIDIFASQILLPMPETIFHQHTHGTSGNVAILNRFGIRPVVQMRNMLDSIVSVVELLSLGETQNLGIYYPQDFTDMSHDDQLWWAVKNLPSWYLTFYLSWKYADIPKLIIWYDTYYKNQIAGIRSILEHCGFLGSVDDGVIDLAANTIQIDSRFKFGLPGRGRQILTAKMVRDIEMQAMSWMEGKELIKELMER